MSALSTAQALVFIAKAIITFIMYMQGLIAQKDFESQIKEMSDAIKKAQSGKLDDRLNGGRDVENQINQHTGKGKP